MGTSAKLRSAFRQRRARFHLFWSINWLKTIYFNFKKFPFDVARKLPVIFYGRVKLQSIKGKIVFEVPIQTGMVGFGQRYESSKVSRGTAEIRLDGTLTIGGNVQFGKDYFVYIAENAHCKMGHMSSLGSNGKLICYDSITFGDYARLGFESQVMDSNFHAMIDLSTGVKLPMTAPVVIGNYNYVGNRVSIMQRTITPDYTTVASNSVCNKDYSQLGNNILLGGIPAKLLRSEIARDWEGERQMLDEALRFRY